MATSQSQPNLQRPERDARAALEKLQYRNVQPQRSSTPDEKNVQESFVPLHHPVVTLLPSHEDDPAEAQQADASPDLLQESDIAAQQAIAAWEQRLAEEKIAAAHAIAAAREQGRCEERQSIEERAAADRAQLQRQFLRTLEEFHLERQRYFHLVEGEVVRLSLAIAARVLHREGHLDPMLLTGVVRVALEKLADSGNIVMRVPSGAAPQWNEFFRGANAPRVVPGVLEDPSLAPGECLFQTELGTIELGIGAQLEEIEKGFFDMLDRRPTGNDEHFANGAKAAN